MKKPLIVLSLSVLSLIPLTSCGGSNDFITLTINPTTGFFNDGSDSDLVEKPEYFLVNKGTLLKDLSIAPPMLPTMVNPDTHIHCLGYSDGTNLIGDNFKFDTDITLYACYFSSVNEAQAYAIGHVASSVADACARQPEAIGAISEKTLLINNYIKQATQEYGPIGMGKLGSAEADAFARQPEAIGDIFTLSEIYYKAALECNSDLRANAISRIGASAMDAAARQPEAIKTRFTKAANTAIERTKESATINSFAYTIVGGATMDSIGRQPEASDNLIDGMDKIMKKISLADNSAKAYAIGVAGRSCMDACARQPEAISKIIEATLKNIDDILNS